jgi:hypothetical protein
MKTALAIVVTFGLTAALGCQSMSRRGGSAAKHEGFSIGVPGFAMDKSIKQGATEIVTISLNRGADFKRDVRLNFMADRGIAIEPTSVWIKASDAPEAQLRITAPQDAALGDYRITVVGTPVVGEATTAEFKVKVVAP